MTIALTSESRRHRLSSKPDTNGFRIGTKTISVLEHSLQTMRLVDIKVGQYNLRTETEVDTESKNLSLSIKKNGLINPLTVVMEGKVAVLVAGFRRYKALKEAGIKSAQVLVVKSTNEKKRRAIAIAENAHRKKLHPVELARALRDLQTSLGESATEKDLAKETGMSRSAVAKALGVGRLPEDVQEEALKQKTSVSRGVLEELGQGTTEEEQRELWADVKAGCSRDDVREKKKTVKTKNHPTSKPAKAAPKQKAPDIGKSLDGALKVVRDLTKHLRTVSVEGLSHDNLEQVAELRKAGIAMSKQLKSLLEKSASQLNQP